MSLFRRLSVIVLPFLLLGGCSESPTGGSGKGMFQLESFPNSIGSSWTYEWESRWSGEIDTVVVTVVGAIDSSAVGPARIWVLKHSEWTDTLYEAVTGDTLRFLNSLTPGDLETAIVFPLYVSATWKGAWWIDSSWVPAREFLSVPAGRFSGAYRVEDRWRVLNSYGTVTTWIVPNVGIVMEDRREFNLGPGPNYVRRLLAFEIAEEGS